MKSLFGCGLLLSSALAVAGGGSPSDPIKDAQQSWQGRTLDLQYKMDMYNRLDNTNSMGTHNSFNSKTYTNALRYLDPQQKHSLYDQLRLGARFLELDVHWTAHTHGWPWEWGNDLLLCHSGIGVQWGSLHVGCSLTDRRAWDGLDEIRDWYNEQGEDDEVLVLMIQDETDGRHQELYNILNDRLGNRVYKSGGCDNRFDRLSEADILAAGKNIIVLLSGGSGGCSGNNNLKNFVFNGFGNYKRVAEDGTLVNDLVDLFGEGKADITKDDVRRYFKEGKIDNVNLDNYTYDDGRLEAAIWSWDRNQPDNYKGNQDCAVQWGNARWDDAGCDGSYRYACNQPGTNNWTVTSAKGKWNGGEAACASLGNNYVFSAPTTSAANEAVRVAKGSTEKVWINVNDRYMEGAWQVPIHGEFQIRTMGKCLDIPGDDNKVHSKANVQLWSCQSNAVDQRWIRDIKGRIRNAKNPSVCLDISGGKAEKGKNLQLYTCHDNSNQKWVLDGYTLRSANNLDIAIDISGNSTSNGANAQVYNFHGNRNQRFVFVPQ